MSPVAGSSSYHDVQDADDPPRPLKRARKSSTKQRGGPSDGHHTQPTPPAPVGHIFITDGIVTKKQGGKKAPLSCCECRRLKLKCDRSFPCASCKKRGCSEICPDGVLVSGKGTRFILANTEQLHAKIHEMSERIRCLEEALETLQSRVATDEPHPLMASHFLGIKSTMGLYNTTHEKDQMQGEGTASESSLQFASRLSEDPSPATVPYPTEAKVETNGDSLSCEVMRLNRSFPLPDKVYSEENMPLRQHLRNKLPSREEAEYLWEQTSQNALWQYNPHPDTTFFPTLQHHCYDIPIQDLCPRRLALMFMILAVGCKVDINRVPDTPDAEEYHQLARASLCEYPVMEDTTVATILVLFYEIWYLLMFSDKKKAAGSAWGLMGLTAMLAQSIGLHRNGNKKMAPEEMEKRRALFWELLYLDARLSLSLGRPPSLSIHHADCPRPSYGPSEGCDPTESLHYYQEWKHSCYIQCLAPVLEATSNPSLEYTEVLHSDRRIRDFAMPAPLLNGQSKALFLQRGSLSIALEAVLLQLHRPFFVRVLSNPDEPLNRYHKYVPSVPAVFLSASRMIATVEELFQREPQLTSRFLGYWSNAFSSAVALCLLVSRAPFACLSPAALYSLQRARTLFTKAADTCPRASEVKPMLDVMIDKANDIYLRWTQGHDIPGILKHHPGDCPPQESDYRTPGPDAFDYAHPALIQCSIEAQQQAKEMAPTHKFCRCPDAKPWTSIWYPPLTRNNAPRQQVSPVLPGLTSPVLGQAGLLYTNQNQNHQNAVTGTASARIAQNGNSHNNTNAGVLEVETGSGSGRGPPPPPPLLSGTLPSMVNPLNIEIGAICINNEQGLMSFF